MNQIEKLNLAYPNAVFCAIALKGAPVNGHNGCSKYELSRACLEAANLKLPPIHDFNLGRPSGMHTFLSSQSKYPYYRWLHLQKGQ